jgi:hypothetical protein
MWKGYDVTGNDAVADAVVVLTGGSGEYESVMGVNVAGAVKGREGKRNDTETVVTVVGGQKKKRK